MSEPRETKPLLDTEVIEDITTAVMTEFVKFMESNPDDLGGDEHKLALLFPACLLPALWNLSVWAATELEYGPAQAAGEAIRAVLLPVSIEWITRMDPEKGAALVATANLWAEQMAEAQELSELLGE